MANEKVTLRFEEFDDDNDGVIMSGGGPLSVYDSVDAFEDLDGLTLRPSFPRTPVSTNISRISELVSTNPALNPVIHIENAVISRAGEITDTDLGDDPEIPLGLTYMLRETVSVNDQPTTVYTLKKLTDRLVTANSSENIWTNVGNIINDTFLAVNENTLYVNLYNNMSYQWTSVDISMLTSTFGVSREAFVQYDNDNDKWVEFIPQDRRVIVFVRNVNDSAAESQRDRGAYFMFDQAIQDWVEILLGTHSHDNKEFLDKLGAFDLTTANMGKGMLVLEVDSPDNGLSFDYDVRFEEIPEQLPAIDPDITTPLYLHVKNSGSPKTSVKGNLSVVDGKYIVTFSEPLVNTFGLVNDQRIFQHPLSNGETGYFGDNAVISNIIDSSSFEVSVAHVTNGTATFDILVKKEAAWTNELVPAQTFTIRKGTSNANVAVFNSVDPFNKDSDAVLIISENQVFQAEPGMILYENNNVTITIATGSTFGSEDVTLIILRNGADSFLENMDSRYITKEEGMDTIIAAATGGSLRLRDYAKKDDLRGKANRYHTHSQFARVDHDHDYRYANFNHTHNEYMNRASVLELIRNTLYIDPNITDTLVGISDFIASKRLFIKVNGSWKLVETFKTEAPYIDGDYYQDNGTFYKVVGSTPQEITVASEITTNTIETYAYTNTLNYLSFYMPTRTEVDTITGRLTVIEDKIEQFFDFDISNFESYLSSRKFRADQIDTTFVDPLTNKVKDLDEVLQEMRYDIDNDLANVNTDDVFIPYQDNATETEIPVRLPPGTSVGQYGSTSDNHNNLDTVPVGPLTNFIKNLVQKRVPPVYTEPTLSNTFTYEPHPQKGSTITMTIETVFTQNDGGPETLIEIIKKTGDCNENAENCKVIISSSEISDPKQTFSVDLPVGTTPFSVYVKVYYSEGPIKQDSFNEPDDTGRIDYGYINSETDNNEYALVTPVNALLKGFAVDDLPLVDNASLPSFIVNNTSAHTDSYPYASFEQELIVDRDARVILFALPVEITPDKLRMLYREQGNIDIFGEFKVIPSVMISHPNGDPVEYRVYYYEIPSYILPSGERVYLQLQEEMTLTFLKGL